MNRDARFYFANLGADVARCANAVEAGNHARYEDALSRAYETLDGLRRTHRPEAYEEGILLLRALEEARSTKSLPVFRRQLNNLIAPFVAI